MIVVDASATVDYLLGTMPEGVWVRGEFRKDDDLRAPHLLDVEVANALRRLVIAGSISARTARRALDDFEHLGVTRYPHLLFLDRIWALRSNLSAYDATYVALAEALGGALVTTDRGLAGAPGIRAAVLTP